MNLAVPLLGPALAIRSFVHTSNASLRPTHRMPPLPPGWTGLNGPVPCDPCPARNHDAELGRTIRQLSSGSASRPMMSAFSLDTEQTISNNWSKSCAEQEEREEREEDDAEDNEAEDEDEEQEDETEDQGEQSDFSARSSRWGWASPISAKSHAELSRSTQKVPPPRRSGRVERQRSREEKISMVLTVSREEIEALMGEALSRVAVHGLRFEDSVISTLQAVAELFLLDASEDNPVDADRLMLEIRTPEKLLRYLQTVTQGRRPFNKRQSRTGQVAAPRLISMMTYSRGDEEFGYRIDRIMNGAENPSMETRDSV